MSTAAPAPEYAFSRELSALLRVRRQISRSQRESSPWAWWIKNAMLGFVAAVFIAGSYVGGWAIASDSTINVDRAAALFLAGPITAAGFLLIVQMREGSGGHVTGELRRFLPISRRRSAILRVAEDTLQPGSLFVILYGWAAWAGILRAGEHWLNGWGWVCVALLPLLAIMGRHALAGFQAWTLEAAGGATASVIRLALTLAFVLLPAWISLVGRLIPLGAFDVLALPALDLVNNSFGPIAVAAATAVLAAFAVWTRTWRPLRLRLNNPLERLIRKESSQPLEFRGGHPQVVMVRMMFLQASRQANYRYGALMLLLFGGLGAVVPAGAAVSLILMSGFLMPITNLYNLYGADAKSYLLWMGSGRTLAEWTLARQLFTVCHFAAFIYVGGLLLLANGIIPRDAVPGLLPLPIIAASVALLAGPLTSQFIVAPVSPEVGFRSRGQSSPRNFFATLAALFTGALVLGPGVPLAFNGSWWATWGAAAAIVLATAAIRPFRVQWSPSLRTRMAMAFRG